MKKLLSVALILLGASSVPARAQRHVKHMASWGAHIGRSEKGNYYELSYTPMLTDRLGLRISGLREDGTLGRAAGEYAAYQGRVLLAPQLFRLGETVYVHVLFGAGGQYERTKEHETGGIAQDAKKPQRFTYGLQAGAEADIFLSNRFSLVATGTKGYQFNHSLIDQWPGMASMGFRFHFH